MCKHQEFARLFSILCVKSVKLQITSCTNRATGNWLRQSDRQIMGFDGSDSRNCLHNLSHFNRLLFMQILLEERMPHILHVFFLMTGSFPLLLLHYIHQCVVTFDIDASRYDGVIQVNAKGPVLTFQRIFLKKEHM